MTNKFCICVVATCVALSSILTSGCGVLMPISSLHGLARSATATKNVAIHGAAWYGSAEEVKAILQKSPSSVNIRGDEGMTPLHFACSAGRVEIVKILLEHGANPNISDTGRVWKEPDFGMIGFYASYQTALHHTLNQNENVEEIVELLIARKADPLAKDAEGYTPLHGAARVGSLKLVKLFLDRGANPNAKNKDGKTPYQQAVQYGRNGEIIDLLISRGATPSKSFLDVASSAGVVDAVARQFKISQEELNGALASAAGRANAPVVEALLRHGANIDSDNGAALKKAVGISDLVFETPKKEPQLRHQAHRMETIKLLLGHKANPDLGALHVAARLSQPDTLKLLLTHGAKVNSLDERGRTPLHYLIENYFVRTGTNPYGILTALLDAGANLNIKDDKGQTPLHLAGRYRDVLQVLVRLGADVNVRDNSGKTPLHTTRDLFLLNGGADINAKDNDGRTLLHSTVFEPAKRVKMLLELGADANVQDNKGVTPLHLASSFAHGSGERTDVLALLLDWGADVNSKTATGDTPLHLAMYFDSGYSSRPVGIAHAELLLSKGADVNSKNIEGVSVLSKAVVARQKDMVMLLLAKGADVNDRDKAGNTPLQLALKSNQTEIVNLLRKQGAKE